MPTGPFGAYGKIPALGDFLQVGVSPGFVTPWHQWLQAGLPAVRGAMGDRWQDCYLSAPIWRFTLAAGVAGPQAALGVMMPSVDRVGRQFPLTLVAVLPTVPPHDQAEETFTALEELALDVLDDLPRDALLARLTRIEPPPAGQEKRGVWTTGPLDGARRLEPHGLPTTAQMQMLFDMDAPAWRVMAEKADPL